MRVWVAGRVLDSDDAVVPALDHGFTVGDGVFESVKVVDGVPFALRRHLLRLATSASGMGLPPPDEPVIHRALAALLAEDSTPGDHRLRITWTGGPSPLGSQRGTASPTLVLALGPLPPAPATADVVTVPWTRNERAPTAGLKTTSYADNVVALAYARERGASEAVFANTVGLLCEGTGSNVVLEVDGTLVTPTLASGCLAGVTRALALQWCDIAERDVPMEALAASREVLLASTTRDLQVVRAVDGALVGTGAAGELSRAAVADFARGVAEGAEP